MSTSPNALQRTVEIVFNATNNVGGVVNRISQELDTFASTAGNLAQPFADMADKVLTAETAIAALAAGVAALSIKEAGDFEAHFNQITTLINESGDNITKFRNDILEYSKSSTQSLDTITNATYSAISAGVDYQKALGALGEAEKLAVAGNAQLDSTLVALVSTLNAYGASTDDAGKYADMFFKTLQYGQTTIPDLSSTLAQVTGVAANSGVAFDELAAAIAALTAGGAPTSQAITGIKAAISNIIKPSTEAAKLAEKLGLGFDAAALQSKGFAGVIKDVQKATGGSTEQLAQLFGSVEGLNAVMVLGADKSGTFAKALDGIKNSGGAVDEAFGKMSQNLDLLVQKLSNNVQNALINFGAPLLDDLATTLSGVEEVFKQLGAAIQNGALSELQTALEQAFRETGDYLKQVAKVLPEALETVDWSGLVRSAENLAQSLGGLFGAAFGSLDLTTVDGLAKFIQKLVDALSGLTNVAAGTVDGLRPLATVIGTVIDAASSMDSEWQTMAGEILGWGKSVATMAEALSNVAGVINGVGDAIKFLASNPVATGITALAGAGGLAAAFTSVSGAASAFATFLAGAAGPAAAIAGLVAGVASIGVAYKSWQDAEKNLRDSQEQGIEVTNNLLRKYGEISAATGVAIESTEDFHKAIKDGALVWNDAERRWESAAQAQARLAQAAIDAKEPIKSEEQAWAELREELAKSGLVLDEHGNKVGAVAEKQKSAKDEAIELAAAYYEMQGNSKEVALAMAEMEASTAKSTEKVKDAKNESEKLRIELEKLASNERIKTIEVTANIEVAKIQAQAKEIEAAFQSANKVMETTSSTIKDVFDVFTSGKWGIMPLEMKNLLYDTLEQQLDLQERAMQNQEKLVEAQVALMEARADAMRRGFATIQIESNGLEPALEMVMWEILKKVQLRVNQEAGELLMGLGAATLPAAGGT